jgi:hypothetical protein
MQEFTQGVPMDINLIDPFMVSLQLTASTAPGWSCLHNLYTPLQPPFAGSGADLLLFENAVVSTASFAALFRQCLA